MVNVNIYSLWNIHIAHACKKFWIRNIDKSRRIVKLVVVYKSQFKQSRRGQDAALFRAKYAYPDR